MKKIVQKAVARNTTVQNTAARKTLGILCALLLTVTFSWNCNTYAFAEEMPTLPVAQISMKDFQNSTQAVMAMLNDYLCAYFGRAVFVGDSLTVGFEKYAHITPTSPVTHAQFLCTTGYSAWHAIRGIDKSKLQPEYLGEKRNVWDSISMMDVDRVFLMFGTNDLIMCNTDTTAANIIAVADKISQAKPGVEINIISMTPVYATTNKGNLNAASIDLLNLYLKTYCSAKGYGYVDLNTFLRMPDGSINPVLSSDQYVHQNFTSYAIWDVVMQVFAASKVITK